MTNCGGPVMLLPSCIRDVTAKDYSEPLLNRQPPLSSHLPVSQGWPALNEVQPYFHCKFFSKFVEIT